MDMKSSALLLLFLIAASIAAPPLQAQQTPRGALEGTVTDAQGEPLAGVNVSAPALERGTATEADGTYRLTRLPAQMLRVRFSFVGYETAVREVAVPRGATAMLDVTLQQATIERQELVVTGTPTAQDPLTATQQVNAVTPADLQANRTAALGDVIQESVPGAASVQTGPQAGKPVLRGLTGNRVKLLVDAIGQEYYQYGVRHFPNTALAEAQRIEIVRGPASILYGSDALGGAINVIPRGLPQEGVGGGAGGQYFANNNERAGTLDLHGGTALGEETVFGVRAGLERRVAGDFTTPEAPTFFETMSGGRFGDPKYTGTIPFTNFDQWTGYAQAGLDGAFGNVQVFGDYWQNRHNFILPTGGPDDDNPESPPVDGLGQNIEHANVALKGTLLAGDFMVKPRLSYQNAVRQSAGAGNTLEVVDEAEENGGFDYPVDLEKDIYTGRLDVLHPAVGALSGTLGAEVRVEDGQSKGPVPLEPTAEIFQIGAYAFEDVNLDPVTLSAGARVDYRSLTSDPPQATAEALGLSAEDLEKSYTTLSGSVGANYQFAEGFALAANLGTGFRAPSIFELYANGQHGGVAAFQQGNPALEPERSVSADLGVRARTGRLTGELTGYVNRIQDYIFLQNTGENLNPDGSGPPVYTSGQTDAQIAGLEASARVRALPWLELGGEAALITSEGDDLEENNEGDRLLPLIPADRLGGHVRVEPGGRGMLSAPFVQARVRHAFSKDAAGTYEPFSQFDRPSSPPPFGTASTKAYTLFDLTAGATVAFGGASLNMSVGVKNLFDQTYRSFLDTYKGYALSPGRNVFVKASVPFGTGP